MNLSEKLKKRLDDEIDVCRIRIMSGALDRDNYKWLAGRARGLADALIFLAEALDFNKEEEDDIEMEIKTGKN